MKFGQWKMLPVLVAAVAVLSACGKSNYARQTEQSQATANQYVTIKPKIDIIVFQDNSDSVMVGTGSSAPITRLKPQMQNFLNRIGSQWDFHFTVLPLLSTRSLSSKYVVASNCSEIRNVLGCYSPSEASAFNNSSGDYGWINSRNSAVGSADKGYQNIYANLTQGSMTSSGFRRSDAALAIVVISNGEDTTDVGYKDRGDGVMVMDYDSAQTINSFYQYRNAFRSFTAAASLAKFYSVVAPGGSCLGSSSYYGRRYVEMADALGSRSYNLCNSELDNSLDSIKTQLQTVVQSVIFNYFVLDKEPLVSSIKMYKNGALIPESSSNGWTYVGYQDNQPTSRFPAAGNNRSGYMLKLNGTAEFKGSDVVTVDFQRKY